MKFIFVTEIKITNTSFIEDHFSTETHMKLPCMRKLIFVFKTIFDDLLKTYLMSKLLRIKFLTQLEILSMRRQRMINNLSKSLHTFLQFPVRMHTKTQTFHKNII